MLCEKEREHAVAIWLEALLLPLGLIIFLRWGCRYIEEVVCLHCAALATIRSYNTCVPFFHIDKKITPSLLFVGPTCIRILHLVDFLFLFDFLIARVLIVDIVKWLLSDLKRPHGEVNHHGQIKLAKKVHAKDIHIMEFSGFPIWTSQGRQMHTEGGTFTLNHN